MPRILCEGMIKLLFFCFFLRICYKVLLIIRHLTVLVCDTCYCVQTPSDTSEVHHPETDQEQWGERAASGVTAWEESLRGAGRAQPTREGGVRAGTHWRKKHHWQVRVERVSVLAQACLRVTSVFAKTESTCVRLFDGTCDCWFIHSCQML